MIGRNCPVQRCTTSFVPRFIYRPEPSPRTPPKRLSQRGLRAHIPVMNDEARDKGEPRPAASARKVRAPAAQPREIGGAEGPEPTRYGDWEYNGRCTDF